MSVRAAVARHVLQLTLRREFASAAALARDDKGASTAHDWATQVLGLPRNDWDGTVAPPPPSSKPKRAPSPKPVRKLVPKERTGWAAEVSRAVADRPPPRPRRGWGLARVGPPPAKEPKSAPAVTPPQAHQLPKPAEEAEGRQSHRTGGPPILDLVPADELLARLSARSGEPEGAAPTSAGLSIPGSEGAAPPRRNDMPPTSQDELSVRLEDVAPTLLGTPRKPSPPDERRKLLRVPKGKFLTRLGEEVPPWSRRDLRVSSRPSALTPAQPRDHGRRYSQLPSALGSEPRPRVPRNGAPACPRGTDARAP